MEVHQDGDQFFRFEKGEGKSLSTTEYIVGDGDTAIVPTGAMHNVINTSTTEALKFILLTLRPTTKTAS